MQITLENTAREIKCISQTVLQLIRMICIVVFFTSVLLSFGLLVVSFVASIHAAISLLVQPFITLEESTIESMKFSIMISPTIFLASAIYLACVERYIDVLSQKFNNLKLWKNLPT